MWYNIMRLTKSKKVSILHYNIDYWGESEIEFLNKPTDSSSSKSKLTNMRGTMCSSTSPTIVLIIFSKTTIGYLIDLTGSYAQTIGYLIDFQLNITPQIILASWSGSEHHFLPRIFFFSLL